MWQELDDEAFTNAVVEMPRTMTPWSKRREYSMLPAYYCEELGTLRAYGDLGRTFRDGANRMLAKANVYATYTEEHGIEWGWLALAMAPDECGTVVEHKGQGQCRTRELAQADAELFLRSMGFRFLKGEKL